MICMAMIKSSTSNNIWQGVHLTNLTPSSDQLHLGKDSKRGILHDTYAVGCKSKKTKTKKKKKKKKKRDVLKVVTVLIVDLLS